jgi:hypothetical protein
MKMSKSGVAWVWDGSCVMHDRDRHERWLCEGQMRNDESRDA